MNDNANSHGGHRARLRQRFMKYGLDSLADHEIIEMMLFYALPRKDTNELAHKLIDKYGSISNLMDTRPELLEEQGLTDNLITFFKLIPELCQRYYIEKTTDSDIVYENSEMVHGRLRNYFISSADEERVVLMLLNPSGKELYCDIVSRGSINASEIYTRSILGLCMKYGAAGAVIAHNHPSGILYPSQSDLNVTKTLKRSMSAVGVRLFDHIIIKADRYYSMAEDENFSVIFE